MSKANKQALLDYLNLPEEKTAALTKADLLKMARNKFLNNQPVLGVEEIAEESPVIISKIEESSDAIRQPTPISTIKDPNNEDQPSGPRLGEKGWTDFVLSLLHDEEKPNGKPKADGLRRIFSQVINGAIIENDVQIVGTATPENNNRATVIYKLTYVEDGLIKTRTDAADCSNTNARRPFSHHPTATAVTMAEGRCLRKIFQLNVIMDEESLGEDNDPANISFATQNQSLIINKLCESLNIDVMKFLEKYGVKIQPDKDLKDFTSFEEAQSMLKILTGFKKSVGTDGHIAIPTDIIKS